MNHASPELTGSTHARRRGRGAVASVSALLVVGLLAGCSTSTATSDETSAAAADTSATIAYEYAGYETTLPANPQRVVVLDSRAGLEMALLADYPIVATAYDEDGPLSPLLDDSAAHLKNTAFELNREEVASYNPDLIVVDSGWLGVYEDEGLELDTIAPVLSVKESNESPDDEQFTAMVDQLTLLERSKQADEVVAGYEAAVANAKDTIGDEIEGKTISVIHLTTEGITVITDEDTYQSVLPDLGFKILDNEVISSAPAGPAGINHALSYENALSALGDADIILLYKSEEGMTFDPLLERVPAIAEGNWINGNLAERVGFALTNTSLVNS
ncbi:MAG: ABC transporter substrate-binding protein, partial [Mycetocola sp.]